MQKSFEVSASTGSYNVIVGRHLLQQVMNEHPDAFFIIDELLKSRLPAAISKKIVVEAVEANKSLETIPGIIQQLRKLGADRSSHLVAIGGGIIQDIATFAASIYMRGIPWTYMPTTLLSMVDSCIGGKSSINTLGYKNLVGNFYPPGKVLVDTSFVDTLDAEMIVGGLFEAAKICYARGYPKFLEYLAADPGVPMSADRAQRIIMHSLQTKVWFIETDEFDQKERLLLNFGHTFGHAIEAGTEFGVSHGIGVGLGMLAAVKYARQNNRLAQTGSDRTDHLVQHIKTLLGGGSNNVVQNPPVIDLALVMDKFDHDKKHRSDSFRIIVPQGDGALELISEPKNDKVRNDVVTAYERALQDVGWPFTKRQRAAFAL